MKCTCYPSAGPLQALPQDSKNTISGFFVVITIVILGLLVYGTLLMASVTLAGLHSPACAYMAHRLGFTALSMDSATRPLQNLSSGREACRPTRPGHPGIQNPPIEEEQCMKQSHYALRYNSIELSSVRKSDSTGSTRTILRRFLKFACFCCAAV